MEKEIVKEYKKGDFTVVWKPKACIHAAECVKALPNVYRPKEKPWIILDNAIVSELEGQIAKCPSGALSHYVEGEEKEEVVVAGTKVEVMPNGPLLVFGAIEVKDKEGNTEMKDKTTAFCRCGASGNKPYCDGGHAKVNFKD